MNLAALPPSSRLAILRDMKTYLRTAVLAIAIATLCACGAKGPLFMPEEAAPPLEMAPEPVEEPAPAEADAVDAEEAEEEVAPTTPGAGA